MKHFLFCLIFIISFVSCKHYSAENDKEFINKSGIRIEQYNSQTIENLTVLCKVWGFIKYYHPAVAEGKYNWDFELFRVMPLIINSKSEDERNRILSNWIKGLGRIKHSKEFTTLNPDSIKMYPDIDWIEDENKLGDVSRQLVKIKLAKRDSEKLDYIEFPMNDYPFFKNEEAYSHLSFPDDGFRLLALFRYWNIIQYYFPYRYLIEENWQDMLPLFIPRFIDAKNGLEYRLILLNLIAKIHDTHANIWNDPKLEEYIGRNIAPLEITFIENKAVVTLVYGDDCLLKVGDVIVSANDVPIDSIIQRKLRYTPASNYSTQLREIASNLLRTNDNELTICYERNGKLLLDVLKVYSIKEIKIPDKYHQDKSCYQVLDNNISYIYLGSTQEGTIPDSISSKGMIIDLRCYPSSEKIEGYWDFLQLYPSSTGFAKLTYGNASHPGLFTYSETMEAGKDNPQYYKEKKIILVNELSQSHAEFMAMKYRCSPNTIVIGSITAGADGGVVSLTLPGGISTSISGSGVYYPDGRETQRIGIVPDIEVKPTIKGIREGRDEVLEKAIEIILQVPDSLPKNRNK
jgi:hypothetical protein